MSRTIGTNPSSFKKQTIFTFLNPKIRKKKKLDKPLKNPQTPEKLELNPNNPNRT